MNYVPDVCPVCGSKVEWKSVDLECTNRDCEGATTKQVEHFIKACGIENVSETSLSNWDIINFSSLLSYRPNSKYKTEVDFYNNLITKVFTLAPEDIMRNFPINGIGTTTYDKLLVFFSNLETLHHAFLNINKYDNNSLPVGIGVKTLENAHYDFLNYIKVLDWFTSDIRYVKPAPKKEVVIELASTNLVGKTFLITGTLSRKRGEVEAEIKANGGIIASGVTKNLNYLIVASEESGSSKYKKAVSLGIKIISEAEYLAMI